MTLHEQTRLKNVLEALKSRNEYPSRYWLDLVAEGIRAACSSESRLYKEVVILRDESGGPEPTESTEKQCRELLTAAQAMLRIPSPGYPDAALVLPHLILDRLFLVFDHPLRIELGR